MLPVMIGALIAMLEGASVLHFLYVGFPVATALAFAWTTIRIQDDIVEVHIRSGTVAIRSLLDASSPPTKLKWYRLLDVRYIESDIQITIGHDIYRLPALDWRTHPDLMKSLKDVMGGQPYLP